MRRWLATLALASCGAPTAPVTTTTAPSASVSSAPSAVVAPHDEPAFAITFSPSFDPPQIGVHVRAKARAGIARWAAASHGTPDVIARDASGTLVTHWKDGVLEIDGAPKTFIDLDYVLAARNVGDVVVSTAGYARLYGEPLLLPIDIARENLHVTVDWNLERAPVEAVASSFGDGKHAEFDVAPMELSKGAWMAGSVFSATFDTYEGKDHFAWIGYSAFDPRWASAEIATMRTSVASYFGDAHPRPFTMLLVIDRKSAAEVTPFSVYPRYHGLFAVVDLDAAWSIGPRMSVALALVSRWIGEPLGASRAITHGLARFVAREVLFASGTMTPAEYVDEINGEIAATLFEDKNQGAAEMARVALDASRIDATVRAASSGKRTMRQVIGEWITRGHPVVQADFDAAKPAAFADATFGKCFARAPIRFEEHELGFDDEKTRASKTLVGVRGPALKAGLREGDALVSLRFDESHPVRVVITRDGKEIEITYRPIGRTKSADGYRVIPNVDVSTCTRAL